jgi:predicted small lipoprotein YifL
MKKTLMIAATLLSLGTGAAFADGNVYAPPAQVTAATTAQQANNQQQQRLFPASTRQQTNVYGAFGYAGLGGGEN